MGSAVVVRLLQMLVMVALAHLLAPSDFGVFALCFMVVNAVNVFRDYGLAQSLIYQKEDMQGRANATFWMSAGFGVVSWFVVYALSPAIAAIFRRPSLVFPLQVMSLSVMVSSAAMVPSALLEKELLFRKRAVPEVANGLVYAGASIALAYIGVGVWSLVIGHLAGVVASSLATWMVAGWRPGLSFHTGRAKESLSYGHSLMFGSVMVFAFFYIDNASIGRWLGVTALGFYNLAFTVCNLPATNITHVVNKVMFPTYTKLNHDHAAVGKAYLQTMKSISVLSFPLALALCVFAQDFVPVLFGAKWLPSVWLFRVLAFYGLYRSIGAMCGSIFMAMGGPHWIFRINAVQVLIAVTAVYPVAHAYGTAGVAVLFTCSYIVGTTIAILRVKQMLTLRIADYIRTLQGPFAASILAAAAGIIPATLLLAPGILRVVAEFVAFAASYVCLVIVLDKGTVEVVREIIRTLKSKRAGISAAETFTP